jgi:prepilin-type N-terminal cleavage/methylation domain-containing protein
MTPAGLVGLAGLYPARGAIGPNRQVGVFSMLSPGIRRRLGFSIVELVIVIVVIGIIAAITIPRVSRGARSTGDSALRSNLAIMRSAIELYASEHGGTFPAAKDAGGTYGAAGSADAFKNQLIYYTDSSGGVSETRDATHIYGPYLRKGILPLPVGANKGNNDVTVANTGPTAGGITGWVYNYVTGEFIANCTDTELDELSTQYNQY